MKPDDYILSLGDGLLRHQWHKPYDVYEGAIPVCPYPNCPRGFPGETMYIPKKPDWQGKGDEAELMLPLEMPPGEADEYRRVEWLHPWLNRVVLMWRLI